MQISYLELHLVMEGAHHGIYPNILGEADFSTRCKLNSHPYCPSALTPDHTNSDPLPAQDHDCEFGATFVIEMYEEDPPQSEDHFPSAPPFVFGSTPEGTTMQEIQAYRSEQAQLPQTTLAPNAHWPPILTPQPQGASMLGNPWPTAMGSGSRIRTQTHYSFDELAESLAPAACTAIHAAPPIATVATLCHDGSYAAQSNIVAPRPRYASGYVQRTQSAPSEARFSGDVPLEGPQSAPAYFVWPIARHASEQQPQISTGQQMQNLYGLSMPVSQGVPSLAGHHVPGCRWQPGTSRRHGTDMDRE